MRIIHVLAGIDPKYGGPSHSVPALCENVGIRGNDVSLFAVGEPDVPEAIEVRSGYTMSLFKWDFARTPLARNLRLSAGLARALSKAAPHADIVHSHGLWLAPNLQAGQKATSLGKPHILSPRGMLSPSALAFSRQRKRLLWNAGQHKLVRSAACLHATSEPERDDIRGLGLTNPIAVIPNGVDVPPLDDSSRGQKRTLLFLGRLHPVKRLDVLMRAWQSVEAHYPEWRLRLVGPSEPAYEQSLRELAAHLGLSRVSIEGAVAGQAKQQALSEAELFVQPSGTESFGMTVAEALAASTPVIVTRGTPWNEVTAFDCGWSVDLGLEPLTEAIRNALSKPGAELRSMGAAGRAWVKAAFSWNRAGAEMEEVYRWLTTGGAPPPTINLV